MNPLYFIVWFPCKLLFKIYFRWEIYGVSNVPRKGPALITSNHASFLDPVLIGTSLPMAIHYLARSTLFKNKLITWILKTVHAIPIDRERGGMAGLKTILEQLHQDCIINLFPEGTRSRDGKLQKAQTGIGLAVIKSEALVIPTRIFGSFEAYSRKDLFPKPQKIIIRYGTPLDFKELRQESKTCTKERLREIYKEVAEQVMEAIARLTPTEELSKK